MRGLGWLVCLLVGVAAAQGSGPLVRFHFLRAGLAVPEYTFEIDQGGGGTYTAENAPVGSSNKYSVAAPVSGGQTVQKLTLSVGMRSHLSALVAETHGLAHCDAHRKGIADTGVKTLELRGFVNKTCTYNYSEDKAVVELTDMFQKMAVTLDLARKMVRDQQYDRLALDGDMTLLVGAVKDGRAGGLANISGTLQGLVDDPAVLERVRVQAGKLLELGVGEK